MPAGLSSIAIQVQVFSTIGLGVAFLGDRLRRENVVGAIVATLGVAVLAIYKIRGGPNRRSSDSRSCSSRTCAFRQGPARRKSKRWHDRKMRASISIGESRSTGRKSTCFGRSPRSRPEAIVRASRGNALIADVTML
ncbi:MAG: hypothetical protein ABI349_14155 [Casimicrobiaceae bacterium]